MQEVNGAGFILFIFMAFTLCLLEASRDVNSWLTGPAGCVLVLHKRNAADESTASGRSVRGQLRHSGARSASGRGRRSAGRGGRLMGSGGQWEKDGSTGKRLILGRPGFSFFVCDGLFYLLAVEPLPARL